MKEQKLKCCPICGCKAELQRELVNYQFVTGEYSLDILWSVGCPKCRIGFYSFQSKEIAVNFWNTSTPKKNYKVRR